MRAKLVALITGLAVVAVCAPVLAHHSFAIEYDAEKPIEGTGVISKVEWTNPHMRVYVDVTEPDGSVTTWNLEMGSPNSIIRRGWKPSDLKAGTKISFKGYAGRQVRTRAAINVITLPDGRSFKGASSAPDAPSN
jgi:Family of unknown function (DUF6152)